MTYFTVIWKPEKADKKLATARTGLFPGEEVWFFGYCNNFRPFASELAVTPLRVVLLQDETIKFSARYDEIVSLTPDEKRGTIEIVRKDGGSVVVKQVPTEDFGPILHYYGYGTRTPPPGALLEVADAARAAEEAAQGRAAAANPPSKTVRGRRFSDEEVVQDRAAAAKVVSWSTTTVKGRPSPKATAAVLRQCNGDERPWLILTSSGGAGTLAAWDDRLAIIKTGGLTSFMAGTLGGERSATFHFPDITGIEFNSGFVNGVLEILTASYSGSANRDFWRGSGQSRNADSNDPWTLSNCLPLSKDEYNECLPEINALKARVSRSKQRTVELPTPVSAPTGDLASQLERLVALHASGALSDGEFAAAKARLLA